MRTESWPRTVWRRRARCWARARLRRCDAAVLDTETSDLHGQVIQVAVVALDGRVLLDQLVRPSWPVTTAATVVNGILGEDSREAPGLAEVAPLLLEVISGKQVLAHNADHDHAVLSADLHAAEMDLATLADRRRGGA